MDPLRYHRNAAGLTREQLAFRAHCSVAWVQQLEAGCRPGKSAVLRRVTAVLAAELGYDYGELLDALDPRDESSPACTPGSDSTTSEETGDVRAQLTS